MAEYVTEYRVGTGGAVCERKEEIVRCRDCRHAGEFVDGYAQCYEDDGYGGRSVEPFGFCAWGERDE